jgi:hypothetical protein
LKGTGVSRDTRHKAGKYIYLKRRVLKKAAAVLFSLQFTDLQGVAACGAEKAEADNQGAQRPQKVGSRHEKLMIPRV